MDTYTLDKTRLELTGGRLVRKDKKGEVEAAYDLRRIKRAAVVETVDGAGVILTTALFSLSYVLYRYIPEGLWRWIAVVISGAVACMGAAGIRSRQILVEMGDDRVLYVAMEMPDQVAAFVAMINQERANLDGSLPAPTNPAA